MNAADRIKKVLEELDLPRNLQKEHQLATYCALLEKWNVRINLTASSDWSSLEDLFRESLWASKKYPEDAAAHLDIGSGAGFPAIILKIMRPALEMDLVESRGKKAVFLETIVYELGLSSTRVYCARLEQFLRAVTNKKWDCISWKALKLSGNDIQQLNRHVHRKTEVWMFHGREPALEMPEEFFGAYLPLWSETMPGKNDARVTAYIPLPRCGDQGE